MTNQSSSQHKAQNPELGTGDSEHDKKGCLCLVLHGHLPYLLGHGTWPHGTDWLCEAATETYVPLVEAIETLLAEGISAKFTIGMTPILTEQLAKPDFRSEMEGYLAHKIQSAQDNASQFRSEGNSHLARLAEDWVARFSHIREVYSDKYKGDIIGVLASFQDGGHVEIISSAATHGYLPLLGRDECVQAQIRQGLATHQAHFGRKPKGFWLPECGYRPRYAWASPLGGGGAVLRKGIEEFLSEEGVEFVFIDSHLLEGGEAIGVYRERFDALRRIWGQFSRQYEPPPAELSRSPYRAWLVNSSAEPKKPLAFFVRDPRTGLQVWSSEYGYPGDGCYLDFHKKHHPGGHRYWRVTTTQCDLGDKQPYEPDEVGWRIDENASHFCSLAEEILAKHFEESGEKGVVCSPYDAELFGHWWFEGPRWLEQVARKASGSSQIALSTCSEYLDLNPPHTIFSLPEGSWGEGGFHWVWLNEWTEWTWKHIYQCEEQMCLMARAAQSSSLPQNDLLPRLLSQLARELLLLESSDWQFLITTWHARDYAETRFLEHLDSFRRLAEIAQGILKGNRPPADALACLEEYEVRDAIFPEVKPEWYADVTFPASI
jgi:1,4-alpha-glucan branching enzyme